MQTLLDRFCRYVQVDTQADEKATTYPSSAGQLELGKMVLGELKALGVKDAEQDPFGVVMGTLPATGNARAPAIAWIAHFDTSPETSGRNVKPIVQRNYSGGDIVLPGDKTKVIRVSESPDLEAARGKTLITTDGTTLLGADDKAGLAVIMEATAYLMAHPEIPHGPIRLCFTCDEEVGHGVDHVDLKKLGAHVGYTLDGGGVGEIDVETFSADLAVVAIQGINIHPSIAKGKMVNAVRLAGMFLERLPVQSLAPEATSEREGFLHPYRIEGGVAEATLRILLRDFDTARLAEQADLLRAVGRTITAEFPRSAVQVTVTP
jgi:tripeptide aminopeptidase